MTFPGAADPGPDQLSSGRDRSRLRATVLTVVAIGAVATVIALVARSGQQHGGARPQAAVTDAAASPTRSAATPSGSVFLEHLPQCTRTDHHHVLTVAFGVNNLGPQSLVLLGAAPRTGGDRVLRLTKVRLGLDACGAAGGNDPIELAPADDAVVAMTFHVTGECPHDSLVAARVVFDAGAAGILHSDSSGLADLKELRFVQC